MLDPHGPNAPPICPPDGGTPPDAWDETLLRVIEAGKLDASLADPKLAGAFAAHQKLESLFALLRGEGGDDPLSLRERARVRVDGIAHEPPPTQLGRYQVRSTLGAGAFGTVYLAHDPDLNRDVAIKVSSLSLRERGRVRADAERADDDPLSLRERARVRADAERADDDPLSLRERARVRADEEPAKVRGDAIAAEARHAASLNHSGIVAIYDVGREGDRLYIVMQYVPGQTLAELMRAAPLAPARAAELLAIVADALHYAHKRGFVHRDLKPANILLDELRWPLIADFGLAVTDETQRTLAGQIAGTPEYMAPEQVRGETHRLDGRTDIWALGVILYELLTGRRPFAGQSTRVVLDEIEHRDPRPPRQINDAIPAELERICLKCLSKRMTDRYSTAADLAANLRRWRKSRDGRARRSLERAKADLSTIVGIGDTVFERLKSRDPTPFAFGDDAQSGVQANPRSDEHGNHSNALAPKEILRWVLCAPAAIVAGFATYFIALIFNRLSLEFQFLNPDSVFGRLLCDGISSGVLGVATVQAAASVAPRHKIRVAVVAAGLFLFLSGLLAYNVILASDWWGGYQLLWTNVGSIAMAHSFATQTESKA